MTAPILPIPGNRSFGHVIADMMAEPSDSPRAAELRAEADKLAEHDTGSSLSDILGAMK